MWGASVMQCPCYLPHAHALYPTACTLCLCHIIISHAHILFILVTQYQYPSPCPVHERVIRCPVPHALYAPCPVHALFHTHALSPILTSILALPLTPMSMLIPTPISMT